MSSFRLLAALLSLSLLGACSSAKPVPGATPQGSLSFVESGFLTDYSRLTPVAPGAARRTYLSTNTSFSSYGKILFDRITLWRDLDDTEPVESEDFQAVADDLYTVFSTGLSRRFALANAPAPGVAWMRVALVAIDHADDQLDVYVTEAAHTTAPSKKTLPAGLREFGRDAWLEAEMLDSVTGEVLFAVVDRAADVIPRAKPLETWRDLHDAFEAWAKIVTERLTALHQPAR